MRCSECNTEQQEGFNVCGECGAKLVSGPDIEEAGTKLFEGEALSYSTSIIREERIPYKVMEEEAGQYLSIIFEKGYFGTNSYMGADGYEKTPDILKLYYTVAEEGQ